MTLDELNAAPRGVAERELAKCCGSSRWASAMAARRPFRDADQLYHIAEEVWSSLDGSDWLEAFAQHPRIGQRASGWAMDEQSGTRGASEETLAKLSERNRAYERKFGHVFLICATGKRADDMLHNLEHRMANDPAKEVRITAAEQAKITRLRLEKLLGPRDASRAGESAG